jgi:hypothetical protein
MKVDRQFECRSWITKRQKYLHGLFCSFYGNESTEIAEGRSRFQMISATI